MAAEPRGAESRTREGAWRWPLGLALALAAMVAGSLAVLGVAVTHPDARVVAHPLAAGGAPPRAAD